VRFEGDQIVGHQVLKAVGQLGKRLSPALLNNDHVQELAFQGDILFQLDTVCRSREIVRECQSEQAVPFYRDDLSQMREGIVKIKVSYEGRCGAAFAFSSEILPGFRV
jgi:hypothetical protein